MSCLSPSHEDKAGVEGQTNTYMLKAEANGVLGLKMFNLNPLDHLIVKSVHSRTAGGNGPSANQR